MMDCLMAKHGILDQRSIAEQLGMKTGVMIRVRIKDLREEMKKNRKLRHPIKKVEEALFE